MIYLLLMLALASDKASEGIFFNNSNKPMICLKDVSGCITSQVVTPGRMCQADAVYFDGGYVFKIPNYAVYACDSFTCYPYDTTSWAIMQFAKHIKRGTEHYEVMELYEFSELMGNKWCAYE